ncbi:MAG: DUF378 domain-containing protein [Burkholderiales bacterium]|nr:DUF378 domain-containing protein [Burkholderiales bacterium]
MKKFIQTVIMFLSLIGAINWGLLGLLNLNIAILSFGEDSFLTRLTYLLVSLSTLYLLFHPDLGGSYIYRTRTYKSRLNHDIESKQMINQTSPLVKEQENFINEGGNSQPLKNDYI